MSDLIERLTNPPRMSVAANRDHLEQLLYGLIADGAAELARLTAEVERLRAENARYCWLRDTANMAEIDSIMGSLRQWFQIDALIDEAIKEAGNG